MPTVYQFRSWDITSDCYRNSQRWATKEAIARVQGEITSEGIEVDAKHLASDVDGMTPKGFKPDE